MRTSGSTAGPPAAAGRGRPWTSARRLLASAALALTLAGCGSNQKDRLALPEFDPALGIAYSVEMRGAPDKDIESLMKRALRLFTLSNRRPSSLARLRRRAESDVTLALKVLRSEGYYGASASFELEPEAKPVRVRLELEPGTRFTIERIDLEAPALDGVTLPSPTELGLAPGAAARAEAIIAVERAAVRWLGGQGFPYAEFAGREAVADPSTHTLAVTSRIEPGPRVRYGELEIRGLESVEPAYIRSYVPWKPGSWYSRREMKAFREAVTGTGLFEVARVEAAQRAAYESQEESSGGRVPIELEVTEAKHRSVGGGARFSTDEGPAASAYLEHRNLRGANETGRLSATAGLLKQELALTLRKPQFRRPGQTLLASAQAFHEEDEAFDETAFRTGLGLQRELSERLRVGAGLSAEVSTIEDSNREGTSYLLGVPLNAIYDASDSLLDPTRGYRLRGVLTPYAGFFDGEPVAFPVLDLHASAYRRLGRHVLAARVRAGSVFGVERDDLPPPKRLYSGGGGSVRGYESRFVGPLDAEGDPIGGRSVIELGLELRLRVTENIGIVPFIEAGAVDESQVPAFDDGVQIGAGLGLRYHTAIGPIRADVGVPLNPREEDDAVQFYVSIGQAF